MQDLSDGLIELRLLLLRTIADVWQSDRDDDEINSEQKYLLENIREEKVVVIEKIHALVNGQKIMPPPDYYAWTQVLVSYIQSGEAKAGGELVEALQALNALLASPDVMNLGTLGKLQKAHLLRTFVESCDPRNLYRFWHVSYGASIDFPNFGVQIIKPTARWNYYGDGEWIKPATEALYLSLPMYLKDRYDVIEEQTSLAIKLTEYYQKFPSFIGPITGGITGYAAHMASEIEQEQVFLNLVPNDQPPTFIDTTLKLRGRDFKKSQKNPSGNNYDLGIDNGVFLGFSSMLIKLIPILWANKTLRARLNYGQRMIDELNITEDVLRSAGVGTKGYMIVSEFELSYILGNLEGELAKKRDLINEQYDLEINAILREHLDYPNPWVFKIRLIYSNEITFKSILTGYGPSCQEESVEYILNMATIEVPYAPSKRDRSDTSLALARYNATGPSFPFTCS